MGAVFGLSVVPVFAKEAAPKPASAPRLDNENLPKIDNKSKLLKIKDKKVLKF